MKKLMLVTALMAGMVVPAKAVAQESTVTCESVTVTEVNVDCKTVYSSPAKSNWFAQIGAGIQVPFVEYGLTKGDPKHHITMTYNLGFGKWFSPYLGWRFTTYYGLMRWDDHTTATAKVANANVDLMWDMCNTIAGYSATRPVSVIPFVGVGGTFCWDFKNNLANIHDKGTLKSNQWTLPVSAGVQLRFRLCKYADFFVEGRAQFYGDNFNNRAYGSPIDVNLSAIGGFNINFGGREFQGYNPCDYLGYVADLNNQVNALRGDLIATTAALAVAESQLPCPEVKKTPAPVTEKGVVSHADMLTTVRFDINSATVSPEEMVNVYNMAQWMKANPDAKITVVGYADKDTGTAEYNMKLSQERAQAVTDLLVKNYGIDANRLSVKAYGSDSQPYPDNNNWNRIVVFAE